MVDAHAAAMKRAAGKGPIVLRFVVRHVLLGSLAGCTQYSSLAAGPAVAFAPEEDRPSGAVTVEVAEGTGSARADGRRTSFVDLRARLLLAERHQQAAALAGISSVHWLGRDAPAKSVPLFYGAAIGLGVERIPDNGFFEAVGQARLGSGFTLAEKRTPIQPWGMGGGPPTEDMRTRQVLTLALQLDASPRFTRAPLLVASLMVGIVTFDEVLPAAPPPLLRQWLK